MKRVLVGDAAVADLSEIWEYIASDSVDAADRWVAKLKATFDLISRLPGAGHTRTDLAGNDIRFWPVGNYLILYRERKDEVVIEAVTQGSRDIPVFLTRRLS